MTEELVNGLWNLRLPILSIRKPGWILETFTLPLILLIIPAMHVHFNSGYISWLIASYSIFLVFSIAVFFHLYTIKSKHFKTKYAYQITILLYSIYDLFSLLLVANIFWVAGIFIIEAADIIFALMISQLIIIILAVLLSPWLLFQKIRISSKASIFTLRQGMAILSILPGGGILIAALVSGPSFHTTSTFLAIFFQIGIASLLTYLSITGFYEVILLGMKRWPEIVRKENQYCILQKSLEDPISLSKQAR